MTATFAFHAAALMVDAASEIASMTMIVSPCEKICTVDPGSGLCSGCGRSLAEIERWVQYSDAERARIMAQLPGRLQAMACRREPPRPQS
jgi:predicted Fe-S protein YdhL (DUF1289 family)